MVVESWLTAIEGAGERMLENETLSNDSRDLTHALFQSEKTFQMALQNCTE